MSDTAYLQIGSERHQITLNAQFIPKGMNRVGVAKRLEEIQQSHPDIAGALVLKKVIWLGRGIIFTPIAERLAQQMTKLPNMEIAGKQTLYVVVGKQVFRSEMVNGTSISEALVMDGYLSQYIRVDRNQDSHLLIIGIGIESFSALPSELRDDRRDLDFAMVLDSSSIDFMLDYKVSPLTATLVKASYPTLKALKWGGTSMASLTGLMILVGLFVGISGTDGADNDSVYKLPDITQHSDKEIPLGIDPDDLLKEDVIPIAESHADNEPHPQFRRSSTTWDTYGFVELAQSEIWLDLNVSRLVWRRDQKAGIVVAAIGNHAREDPNWHLLATAWGASLVGPEYWDNQTEDEAPSRIGDTEISISSIFKKITRTTSYRAMQQMEQPSPASTPSTNIPSRERVDGMGGMIRKFQGGFDVRTPQGNLSVHDLCSSMGGDYRLVSKRYHQCLSIPTFYGTKWQRASKSLPPGRLERGECSYRSPNSVPVQCSLTYEVYSKT